MQTSELLAELEYTDSPSFLGASRFGEAPEHAHIFRRAAESFHLHGVYLLREGSRQGQDVSTPVVYVAEAKTQKEADEIHRKVWNQNVVPFLLVRTPEGIRLYSGFRYDWKTVSRSQQREQQGVLEAAIAFNEVAEKLAAFRARAIDDGRIWKDRGWQVESQARVDWRLLDALEKLGEWLHKGQRLEKEVANALIGKFVYLRYLRDRNILSDRKLQEWGIDLRKVFGRNATIEATRELVERVDEWLNGAIFPFPFSGKRAPRREHIQRVAAIFLGDETSTGQLHLDFQHYDFSYIPIETLSVIYEQFLASEGKDKASGAYYTPIPLVNFMLAELDDHRPLVPGMRVLDPACGSGAFLVQCYRRLIERRLRESPNPSLRPAELRDLLVKHIYGVDHDENACRVAALSLVLTMLDYIKPPDLQSTPNFKLPDLHGRNIFHADFFDPEASWCRASSEKGYDWILGNPPWKSAEKEDQFSLGWIQAHAKSYPVVRKQIAEAFAWKAPRHLAHGGIVGLLLPATTFFTHGEGFRASFLHAMDVLVLANFSNLRRDLFGDRVEEPAAAILYSPREAQSSERDVLVYSPLLVNQEFGRPAREMGRLKRKETWGISLNVSEVRQIQRSSIADGDSLPWKVAMWGSHRDLRLISRAEKRWDKLGPAAEEREVLVHPGLELRDSREQTEHSEPIDPVPEVLGELRLNVKPLYDRGRIYSFPPEALESIEPPMAYARKGRGKIPLKVCKPPHVIVSGARTFSVFSDEFIVIPPRQIGIAGPPSQRAFLIALSLYLSSDFTQYYEFFRSPQGGIKEGRSTLETLKSMPCPIGDLDDAQLRRWAELQAELAAASSVRWLQSKPRTPLFDDAPERGEQTSRLESLERDLNQIVNDLLELSEAERWLVHDLVHVRMHLTDGNVGEEAVRRPEGGELAAYGEALRRSLDDFIEAERHHVVIVYDGQSGMVEVTLASNGQQARPAQVYNADETVGSELAALRRRVLDEAGQWIYFDRNLHLYRDDRVYLLKPMQRVGWTRSQALLDADEIIAAALAPEGR